MHYWDINCGKLVIFQGEAIIIEIKFMRVKWDFGTNTVVD
jgi:hypothetical protein